MSEDGRITQPWIKAKINFDFEFYLICFGVILILNFDLFYFSFHLISFDFLIRASQAFFQKLHKEKFTDLKFKDYDKWL